MEKPLTRAKLYRLNDGGQWDDVGTGTVDILDLTEQDINDGQHIMMKSEENQKNILCVKILPDETYARQGDTIITWPEPTETTDIALSFQESSGCQYVWSKLCLAQGKPESQDTNTVEIESDSQKEFSLPAPEFGSLTDLAQALLEVSFSQKDTIATSILEQSYIPKLIQIFQQIEDLEDESSLHILFIIFKSLVLLNNISLLEFITSDEYIYDVAGILEYDPEIPQDVKPNHREFLREKSHSPNILPITNQEISSKISQTYRLQYLKDVVLPRALDDATFTTLNSMIVANNIDVITSLQQDKAFINQILDALQSEESTTDVKRHAIGCLNEMCGLAKNLQPSSRDEFYRSLYSAKSQLFPVLEAMFGENSLEIRMNCVEILSAAISHDPTLVRPLFLASHKHKQERGHDKKSSLLGRFIAAIAEGEEVGLLSQIAEMAIQLLDPDTMDPSDKEEFLDMFYDEYFGIIASSFDTIPNYLARKRVSEEIKSALSFCCELLCFCIKYHGFRVKYVVVRFDLGSKVLQILGFKDKFMQLGAIRFVRSCVEVNDEFYYRYITKKDLLSPVLQLLLLNKHRDNMVNSAVIELFEFIRTLNKPIMLEYIASNFTQDLQQVRSISTFSLLLESSERKSLSPHSNGESTSHVPVNVEHKRMLEQEEDDAYFDADSDEEDNILTRVSTINPVNNLAKETVNVSAIGPLVDYEDEDNQEPATINHTNKEENQDFDLVSLKRTTVLVEDDIETEKDDLNPEKRRKLD